MWRVQIPIIYYGTEQAFDGTTDPFNREELWPTGYPTNTQLYQFLSTAISYRKQQTTWINTQIQRYADDTFYAFNKENYTFVTTTNVGAGGATQHRTIT